MRDLQTLRQELKDARQEVRNLIVMAMRPDISPAKAELIRNLERSARAEVKLRLKALRYAEKLAAPAVRTGPPARPGARPETPAPPLATSSTPSDDRLRAAILLGSPALPGWMIPIAASFGLLRHLFCLQHARLAVR